MHYLRQRAIVRLAPPHFLVAVSAPDVCSLLSTDSPRNVTLTAPTSTTLLLRWKLPEEDPNDGTILRYIILCGFGDGDSLQPRDVSASIRSLQLTDLRPFTTYNCCVSAQRTNGDSPETCRSETTPQDGESSR